MNELKQCPFCGGKAVLREEVEQYDLTLRITCESCFATTPKVFVDNDKEKATNKITKIWNRRTSNV